MISTFGVLSLAPMVASATPVQHDEQFCLRVDVEFNDDGWGDRWADNSVDQLARGFKVRVYRELDLLDPDALDLVWEGNVVHTDPDGCTPPIALTYDVQAPSDWKYSVRVYSYGAFVDGNTVGAFSYVPAAPTEPSPSDGTFVQVATHHMAPLNNIKVYPPPIPGHTFEPRFNVLAFATFALKLHDGSNNETYRYEVAESGGSSTVWKIHLSNPKRSVYSHETGHGVTKKLSGGISYNTGAPNDNCLGDGSNPNDPDNDYVHLNKEWDSLAAKEGIADFYGYITWNQVFPGADCEWGHHHASDWDNNGVVDTPAGVSYDCIGVPVPGIPYADESEWLADLIPAPDLVGCTGTFEDVGTIHDWSRYLFAMVTNPYDRGSPHTLGDIWDIWTEAHPEDWRAVGDPGVVNPNEPAARWNAAANLVLGANNNHADAAAQYGLDH